MAIYRLIASKYFDPDEIGAMAAAYEAALIELCITDRDEPLTEDIAKAIVNVTSTGERNPGRIKERALNALGLTMLDDARASPEGAISTASPKVKPPLSP
jgi:hypothetical protein